MTPQDREAIQRAVNALMEADRALYRRIEALEGQVVLDTFRSPPTRRQRFKKRFARTRPK